MKHMASGVWALGLALLLAVGACAPPSGGRPAAQSQGPAATDPVRTLYEAALKEGEVQSWGGIGPEEVAVLKEAFQQRFPGIDVKHFEIRPDDFVSRVVTEAQQGRISLDVGAGRMAGIAPLIDRDLVQGHDDWLHLFPDIPPQSVSENGRLLTYYHLLFPLAYNTNLVKPEEVPTSWDDLLQPRWRGRVMLEPRANALAYLGIEWGEERVLDYAQKLRAQDLLFVKGGNEIALQLAAGARPIAIGANTHQLLQDRDKGAPVEWARKVSPIGAGNTSLFVMKGAKNPNAAKLWAGWVASAEGQRINEEKHYRGNVNPGSVYSVAREFQQNNIRVIVEGSENYKEVGVLNEKLTGVLGTR
jgi:iron(III) transport system substrate-binding protein